MSAPPHSRTPASPFERLERRLRTLELVAPSWRELEALPGEVRNALSEVRTDIERATGLLRSTIDDLARLLRQQESDREEFRGRLSALEKKPVP